jgi:hypothetical protein
MIEVTSFPCELLKLATLPDHIGFDVGVDRVRVNAFTVTILAAASGSAICTFLSLVFMIARPLGLDV